MRQLAIKLITTFISIDGLWKIMRPVVSAISLLSAKRQQVEDRRKILSSEILPYLNGLSVLNGPFKGMKYPKLDSVGSTLYPKIIGSYEKELHPTIERLSNIKYERIIDVGCAEGYYAVGFGLLFPNAQVHGYDINPKARNLCQSMATINGTADRLILGDRCTSAVLKEFDYKKKTLILSDCEGFEKDLFTSSNIDSLKRADLLIEIHDFIDITISEHLESLFADSHFIHRVKSEDDLDKAKMYDFPETKKMSLEEKRILFSEGRPQLMEWFFCESKAQ